MQLVGHLAVLPTLQCNFLGALFVVKLFKAYLYCSINVPSQAFIDASSVVNPALSYGADGVLGFGFTRLSMIDSLVSSIHQTTGGNLLYNLFLDNLSEPNFIAVSLQRSTDTVGDVQGTFTIGILCIAYPMLDFNVCVGEYEPQFAHVSNSERIPTWPVTSPSRWNVLVDAVIINNTIMVPSSSVDGVPYNKAVALIDSGASYSYVFSVAF
jgi:hypothetical protein